MIHGDASSFMAVGSHLPVYVDHHGVGLRPQLPSERKWALGLQVENLNIYF